MRPINEPPHSLNAEQAVLGAILSDNRVLDDLSDIVRAQDFYNHANRTIFEAIAETVYAGATADLITVDDYLQRRGQDVGGLTYIGSLQTDLVHTSAAPKHAAIVRDHAISRSLIRASQDVVNAIYRPKGKSVAELLQRAENAVFEISESRDARQGNLLPINAEVLDVINGVEQRMAEGKTIRRPIHRPYGAGSTHQRPAAGQPRGYWRTSKHGQNLVGHEYRNECRE